MLGAKENLEFSQGTSFGVHLAIRGFQNIGSTIPWNPMLDPSSGDLPKLAFFTKHKIRIPLVIWVSMYLQGFAFPIDRLRTLAMVGSCKRRARIVRELPWTTTKWMVQLSLKGPSKFLNRRQPHWRIRSTAGSVALIFRRFLPWDTLSVSLSCVDVLDILLTRRVGLWWITHFRMILFFLVLIVLRSEFFKSLHFSCSLSQSIK